MKKLLLTLLTMMAFSFAFTTSAEAKSKAKHVILIGLDGWGSFSVEKAKMPTIKKLMKEGAFTLSKRSVLPSSSAVNWASMFMGAGPELHGYTQWGSKVPELPSKELNQHGIFPTIFSLLDQKSAKYEIGCIYEWKGIKYVIDSLAVDYFAQAPDFNTHPEALCKMGEKYIKTQKPNLFAMIFDNPDHMLHAHGADSKEYYNKLEELDNYVSRIIEATKEAGIYSKTIFIITADHGGIKKGHGGKTMKEVETPFILFGKNIKKGYESTNSMMQFDIASTIAYIFQLKQPQVWIGRPMKDMFK